MSSDKMSSVTMSSMAVPGPDAEQAKQESNEDDTRESEPVNITSYGIEISRKKIKSVPINEQNDVLKQLGVSAYEQDEFEEGVLQQVDEAIEEQERRIAIKAAEKNAQNIKDEIRYDLIMDGSH